MSYPANMDLSKLAKVDGRLCIDPTDLSAAFPHGGTALGVCQDKVLQKSRIYKRVYDEANGDVIAQHQVGESLIVACYLRGWDESTLALLHPNYHDSDGTYVFDGPAMPAGTEIAGRKLLFSPFDSTHPGFIVYSALPYEDESAEMQLAVNEELETAMAFQSRRDASNRTYQIGLLSELSL